ncbi:MAG: energy transducer TonB [Bacteroidota bacterium]
MAKFLTADLDDMVFEDREKGYGAYFLRKKYPGHLVIGTVVVCLVGSLFGMAPAIAKYLDLADENVAKRRTAIVIDLEDLPPPPSVDEDNPPPPPPPRVPPPQIRTVAFLIPEPTPEDQIDPEEEPTIVEIAELQDAPAIGLEDQEGAEEGFFDGEIDVDEHIPEVIVEPREPGIMDWVDADEQPVPVNMEDLIKLVGYPQMAKDAGIEGTVVVRILVDKTGTYAKHKVINSVHPILDRVVAKHIHRLKFTPAIQGKKPIKFWVNIPFKFQLL